MLLLHRDSDPTPLPIQGPGDLHLQGFGRKLVGPEWSTEDQPPYRGTAHTVIMTLRDAARVEVNGTWYHLTAGRIAVIPAYCHLRRATAGFDHAWITFRTTLANDLVMGRVERVLDLPMGDLWRRGLQAVERQQQDMASISMADVTAIEACLHAAMTAMLDQAATDAPGGWQPEDGIVRRAVRWIEDHYRERPTLEALAAAMGCSAGHLHARFSATLGISPSAYAERQRLRDAQHLLVTTDLPVREVAVRCGYEDPFHFSRVARRFFGRSPQDLRRMGTPSD
jgi:AraC-like DNA-binding protein